MCGRIDLTGVSEEEQRPELSRCRLSVAGMTSGGGETLGGEDRAWLDALAHCATDAGCNETVPKPYLIGRKGDQLRAKAEAPKWCKWIGGKEIL
jgi:hypothetical protein